MRAIVKLLFSLEDYISPSNHIILKSGMWKKKKSYIVFDLIFYGMIVFLVKFSFFCCFLILISAIYLVNKDDYCALNTRMRCHACDAFRPTEGNQQFSIRLLPALVVMRRCRYSPRHFSVSRIVLTYKQHITRTPVVIVVSVSAATEITTRYRCVAAATAHCTSTQFYGLPAVSHAALD